MVSEKLISFVEKLVKFSLVFINFIPHKLIYSKFLIISCWLTLECPL